MAINFPTSPAVNDIYTYLGVDYKWNGEVWVPQLGTLPIANGGTGQTTAVESFDALAPTTTRGDIIYRGATDNLRLAKGTLNHSLVMGANDPAWAQRFGWEVITNTAISGTPTNVDFTGLDAMTSFAKFRVELIGIRPTTDDDNVSWRFGTGGTPTWLTTNEYDFNSVRSSLGGVTNAAYAAGSSFEIDGSSGNASDEYNDGFIDFSLRANPMCSFLINQLSDTTDLRNNMGGGLCRTGTAITAFRLRWGSGSTFQNIGMAILSGLRTS